MCRKAISSNHSSFHDQVRDAVHYLDNNEGDAYGALMAKYPEYWGLVWVGSWVDHEASAVDVEYMSWLADDIEALSTVYWEDGEPWTGTDGTCGSDHLMVCSDCLVVAVNGDTSGIGDELRELAVLTALDDYVTSTGNWLSAADGYDEFSRSACELCGDRRYGSRHELVGF